MTTPLDELIKDLKLSAKQFRTNDEFTALKNLPDILNSITSIPEIIINSEINVLSNINTAMNECITKSDWIGLADYLEYDLIRAIHPQRVDNSI